MLTILTLINTCLLAAILTELRDEEESDEIKLDQDIMPHSEKKEWDGEHWN